MNGYIRIKAGNEMFIFDANTYGNVGDCYILNYEYGHQLSILHLQIAFAIAENYDRTSNYVQQSCILKK